MAKNQDKQIDEQNNLRFYEQLRVVPTYATKPIAAGRLKGMSDINPLFRVKAMTETFGPCGIGWKYEITKQWQETFGQEVKAFTNIALFIKVNGEWSDPIPGTGGATLVEANKSGIYVNDEGFKMSLTDALSVAMKALGVAADIYYSKDAQSNQFETKYNQQQYTAQQPVQQPQQPQVIGEAQYKGEINACADMNTLMAIWNKYPHLQGDKGFRDAWAAKRGQLETK